LARSGAAEARPHREGLRAKLGAATALLRRAGADGVWLFGSLADARATTAGDVDLACSGMDPRVYFDVLADLMTLFGTPVDLVLLERAPASLRDRVVETGEELR
jgi:predicted nucleotidyltransferase